MTLKNNRAPLSIVYLCASFHHHMWIQTGVTVRKRLRLGFDLSDLDLWPLTLTFSMDLTFVIGNNSWWYDDGNIVKKVWQMDRRTYGRTDRQMENTICRAAWSQLKTIRHLFYATSSFVQHFVPIGEFKLEVQSGNAQFGSKSTIFLAMWPSNLMDDLEKQ